MRIFTTGCCLLYILFYICLLLKMLKRCVSEDFLIRVSIVWPKKLAAVAFTLLVVVSLCCFCYLKRTLIHVHVVVRRLLLRRRLFDLVCCCVWLWRIWFITVLFLRWIIWCVGLLALISQQGCCTCSECFMFRMCNLPLLVLPEITDDWRCFLFVTLS